MDNSDILEILEAGLARLSSIATSAGIDCKSAQAPLVTPALRQLAADLEICRDDDAARRAIQLYAPAVGAFLFLARGAATKLQNGSAWFDTKADRSAQPFFYVSTYVSSFVSHYMDRP